MDCLVGECSERLLAMKKFRKNRLSYLVLPAVAVSLLLGCAASQPPVEAPLPAEQGAQLPQEVRDDFAAAMTLMQSEEYGKGIELLNRVVTKSQKNAVPYINLSIAHARLGNTKNAEDNLKLALEIEPDNPVANNEFGIIYRKTGRFGEARQVYEGVLKKYPHYPLAHKNLGILCDLYLRDYVCALKGYEAYSSAMPEDKNAKIWISDVQKKLGK